MTCASEGERTRSMVQVGRCMMGESERKEMDEGCLYTRGK